MPAPPTYVLSLPDTNLVLATWLQIDSRLPQVSNGNPNGVKASAFEGNWCWDYTNKNLYLCTATDGSMTPANTTWSLQNFSQNYATTTSAGVVQLADSYNGAEATRALTGATLNGVMAVINGSGVNNNIKSLTGLTTPLSESQGGTGTNSFATALGAYLPSPSGNAGRVLGTTDGTAITYVSPTAYPNVIRPTTNQTLTSGTCIVLVSNGLTHTLPSGADKVNGSWIEVVNLLNTPPVNVVFQTSDASTIGGVAFPLTVDKPLTSRFRLIYKASTTDWIIGV